MKSTRKSTRCSPDADCLSDCRQPHFCDVSTKSIKPLYCHRALQSKMNALDLDASHILMYPVTIAGESCAPDLPPYHLTLKWFGTSVNDDFQTGLEQFLTLQPPPDPPQYFALQPHVFESERGPLYVLLVQGLDSLPLKRFRAALDVAFPVVSEEVKAYEYQPHITVPKVLYSALNHRAQVTPEELHLKIGPLQYRIGERIVSLAAVTSEVDSNGRYTV